MCSFKTKIRKLKENILKLKAQKENKIGRQILVSIKIV